MQENIQESFEQAEKPKTIENLISELECVMEKSKDTPILSEALRYFNEKLDKIKSWLAEAKKINNDLFLQSVEENTFDTIKQWNQIISIFNELQDHKAKIQEIEVEEQKIKDEYATEFDK